MRRARREVQTPAPCTYYVSAEYRLTGFVQLSNELWLSHPVYTGERVFLDFG